MIFSDIRSPVLVDTDDIALLRSSPEDVAKRRSRLQARHESVNEFQASNSPPDTGAGAAIKKKMRSHCSSADGVVGIDEVFQNAFFKRGSILDHRPLG
jgi:hypothetical protein